VDNEIVSRSLPITNEKVLKILVDSNLLNGKTLDLGAGEGYFSSLLASAVRSHNADVDIGKRVFACDIMPEDYRFSEIECRRCDFNSEFPYDDGFFDSVCSIEVIEHIENQFHFARQVYRILKPGGVALITTPNIMNISSRLRNLAIGYPLLFDPLPISSNDPQHLGGHINPVSFYYLAYAFRKAGFAGIRFHTDRLKNKARFLAAALYVPIRLYEKVLLRGIRKKSDSIFRENRDIVSVVNSVRILLGRTVIMEAVRKR
jgi:SAM-dependent methyltransferase